MQSILKLMKLIYIFSMLMVVLVILLETSRIHALLLKSATILVECPNGAIADAVRTNDDEAE